MQRARSAPSITSGPHAPQARPGCWRHPVAVESEARQPSPSIWPQLTDEPPGWGGAVSWTSGAISPWCAWRSRRRSRQHFPARRHHPLGARGRSVGAGSVWRAPHGRGLLPDIPRELAQKCIVAADPLGAARAHIHRHHRLFYRGGGLQQHPCVPALCAGGDADTGGIYPRATLHHLRLDTG